MVFGGEEMGAGRIAGPTLAAALVLATLPSAPTAVAQAPPAVDQTLLPYVNAKDLVHLPDGRRLHLACMGQGSPVVILTAGSSGWSANWSQIQPAVAAKTRVCAWDRAGFGLSTGVERPQTIDQSTTDLQAALAVGGVAGPYVAVGVSFGGFESLLLADREPSKVVGMVLVDPSFPDESTRELRTAPGLAAWDNAHPPPFIPFLRKCAAALRAGALRPGGPDPDGCLRRQWPPSYPPEVRGALDKALAEAKPDHVASSIESMTNGPELSPLNSKIAVKPGRSYGDMPLIVLTAGVVEGPPDVPAELKPEVSTVGAEWRRAHQELAALSTRGVDRIVPGSSHASIPSPVIVAAIDEVVDEARSSGRGRPAH